MSLFRCLGKITILSNTHFLFVSTNLVLSKDQVMKEKHYKELGDKDGIEIEGTQQDEDHDSVFYSKNPYIQLINIARSKEIDRRHTTDKILSIHTSYRHYISRTIKKYR